MQLDLSLTCGSVHGQIHRFDTVNACLKKKKVFLYSVIERKEKGTSPRKEDMRTIQLRDTV
jgi:hypothetical protein